MERVLFGLCFLCGALAFGDPEETDSERQYKPAEIENGDLTKLFGTNQHKDIPTDYKDFGRRFVLQYPYSEKPSQIDDEAEMSLDLAIKEAIKKVANDDDRLRPVKAPAAVVLAIAKSSALLEKSKPFSDPDPFFDKDNLREANYWNAVWKEDVPDPAASHLRSTAKKVESVKIKVMPGSRLYKLVSVTKDMSPRYLYVVNNKQ